ncbi:MAG: BadF/BadG/BcrA/BcrD ATPase family protein [Pyrinomonadaceae bacterium]
MEQLYLGIDGGQSHTAAVVADDDGRVLGRGRGGPSNHADQPGGRERLRRAIRESVAGALAASGHHGVESTEFAAAHCAMTGAGDYKHEIISQMIKARRLKVGHDAPAALAGATGGQPGVVVIAGTGSVAYGEDAAGRSVRTGGWGFLFGDEGGGFWTAAEGVRRAMKAQDETARATALGDLAREYFSMSDLDALAAAFYYEKISRDGLASFARIVHQSAEDGDEVARAIISEGSAHLARLGATVARRLGVAARVASRRHVSQRARTRAFAAALDAQAPAPSPSAAL